MAFTQTQANKKGGSLAQFEAAAGHLGTRLGGGVTLYVGTVTSNDPNFAANKGDLCIDIVTGPDLYMNTDGASTWEKVGTQS